MKVFLNPGHCPDYDEYFDRMADSGAVNEEYGLTEAELVAQIGALVKKYLEAVGIEVESLQSNNLRNGYDDDLSQPCIVTECNRSGADYAVSIHLNAANGIACGTETWAHDRGTTGEKLAKCIQRKIVDTIGTVDRGVKYNADKPEKKQYSFIRKTDIPAVLVECCFIDSKDVALLLDDETIDLFARAIACGITDFISKK